MRRLALFAVTMFAPLAACDFNTNVNATDSSDDATYQDCVDDTQAFCNERGLSGPECTALIAQTCDGGGATPDAAIAEMPDAGGGTPDAAIDENAVCIDDALAQCAQLGLPVEQCQGLAEQYCAATGGGGGGGGDTCIADALVQCEQLGLPAEQCQGLAEQYCAAGGGGGVDPGGGGGGDPTCLIETVTGCIQAGGDAATCLALAQAICQ